MGFEKIEIMSTPTLTREQVITLQFIHRSAPAPCLDLSWDFLEDLEDEDHPLYLLVGVDDNSARLTDAGREALAAYDSESVTVRSKDLIHATEALDRDLRRAASLLAQNGIEISLRSTKEALARLRAALEIK